MTLKFNIDCNLEVPIVSLCFVYRVCVDDMSGMMGTYNMYAGMTERSYVPYCLSMSMES